MVNNLLAFNSTNTPSKAADDPQNAALKANPCHDGISVVLSDYSHTSAPQAEESSDIRLKQVLRLAKRGCKLFPLSRRSKVPMKGFRWTQLATNDWAQLLKLFEVN